MQHQIIWFKKDFRIQDNDCLHLAAKAGNVLPLVIIEPEYWKLNDVSKRHYDFLLQNK